MDALRQIMAVDLPAQRQDYTPEEVRQIQQLSTAILAQIGQHRAAWEAHPEAPQLLQAARLKFARFIRANPQFQAQLKPVVDALTPTSSASPPSAQATKHAAAMNRGAETARAGQPLRAARRRGPPPKGGVVARLKGLEKEMRTYKGKEALKRANQLLPRAQVQGNPALLARWNRAVNRAIAVKWVQRHVTQHSVRLPVAMQFLLERARLTFAHKDPTREAEWTEELVAWVDQLLKDSDLLDRTEPRRLTSALNKGLFHAYLEKVGKGKDADWYFKMASHLAGVYREIGKTLTQLGVSDRTDAVSVLHAYWRLNGKTLRTVTRAPEHIRQLEALRANVKVALKRILSRLKADQDWQDRNASYRTIAASQRVSRGTTALDAGVCFFSSLEVHTYHLNQPKAGDEALSAHLLEKAKIPGSTEEMGDEGRFFSAKQRFLQAAYQVEPDDSIAGTVMPLALSSYHLKAYHKQSLLQQVEANPAAKAVVASLERHLEEGLAKSTHGSLMLSYGGDAGAHTIEMVVDRMGGVFSLWDPDLGQFRYPDYATFRAELVRYLQEVAGPQLFYEVIVCTPLADGPS